MLSSDFVPTEHYIIHRYTMHTVHQFYIFLQFH